MGYTFVAALLKKTTTAPTTRKEFRRAMENLGYRKARSAEEASLSFQIYQDKKSAWLSLALEMPEDLEEELEFLRKVSAEMHTPILYFMNFDSDFLYIAATDGKGVQHVHVGFIDDDDESMEDSDDLSIFDALLPDDAARAEFRRILAVDDEERVFSEEAAQEMAALFGYTPEVLFIDEDAEPFAELGFRTDAADAEEDVPLLMPEDAPVALRMGMQSLDNPGLVEILSVGGVGKGIRVVLQAADYDAQEVELPVLWLTNELVERLTGKPAEIPWDEKVVPRRVRFQDGRMGWVAEFPEAPIYRGVNPASSKAMSKRAYDWHHANCCMLHLAFCGGTFKKKPLVRPDPSILQDHDKRAVWLAQRQMEMSEDIDGETYVWIVPMQNPEKAVQCRIPRRPFRQEMPHDWLRGCWPEDEQK